MSTRSRPARAGFRADIEGLRAVSVLAVLLWHAGLPWMPGGYAGVDVFFVISGFLMTTILLAEAQKRTPPKELLLGFYARRARRLLPAAVVALMGTAALTIIALPPTRWPGIGADIAASAGYVVNWRLAAGSVDYLGQQEPPSPVQHYWSLAVEEQFYLLWPVLIVGVLLLVRQRPARIRPAVGRLSLLVLVVSLGISVWLTRESAGQAYFVTHTRAWELALGSVVAVGASRWRGLSPGPARYVGWTGLGMVLLSLVVLDSGTPFPGTAALLPTVGAAMVLLAGPAAGAAGPVRPARCGCSACPRCSSSAGSPTAFTCGTGRWWWWRCSGGAPVTTCRCAGGWPPSPCRRCRLGCPTGMSSSRSGGEAAAARSRPDAPCTWACGPPWRGAHRVARGRGRAPGPAGLRSDLDRAAGGAAVRRPLRRDAAGRRPAAVR